MGEYFDTSYFKGCYWKNGTLTTLLDTGFDTHAFGLYINGSDIYAVGYYDDGTHTAAVLWTPAGYTVLGPVGHNSYGKSASLDGDNLLISGTIDGVPVVWSYNIVTTPVPPIAYTELPFVAASNANVILVNGSDVYVAGEDNDVPTYWLNSTTENNIASSGSDVGNTYGMAINGTDIYFVGAAANSIANLKPVYWKGGVKTILNTGGSAVLGVATGIYIKNNDVYIS